MEEATINAEKSVGIVQPVTTLEKTTEPTIICTTSANIVPENAQGTTMPNNTGSPVSTSQIYPANFNELALMQLSMPDSNQKTLHALPSYMLESRLEELEIDIINGQESPREWFCRVMKENQLSPMDLADVFYSAKGLEQCRFVSLGHVCNKLYQLDSQSSKFDPMTERMEYTVQRDKNLLIDMKAAIRSLHLWPECTKSTVAYAQHNLKHKKFAASCSESVPMHSNEEKLWEIISKLQDENISLTKQLISRDKNTDNSSDKITHHVEPKVESASSNKMSLSEIAGKEDTHLLSIVNAIGEEGIARFQLDLECADKETSTHFLPVNQMYWILVDILGKDRNIISQRNFQDLCTGLNFNAAGHVEYRELILALRQKLKQQSITLNEKSFDRVGKAQDVLPNPIARYIETYHPDREVTMLFLISLCESTDIKKKYITWLHFLVKVFYKKFVHCHPNLTQLQEVDKNTLKIYLESIAISTAIDINREMTQENVNYKAFVKHLCYNNQNNAIVFSCDFWVEIRLAICQGNVTLLPHIYAKLTKIFTKLDKARLFLVEKTQFRWIFCHHLNEKQMNCICTYLSTDKQTSLGKSINGTLRYDIFMQLVFPSSSVVEDKRYLSDIMQRIQAVVCNQQKQWKVLKKWLQGNVIQCNTRNKLQSKMSADSFQQTLSSEQVQHCMQFIQVNLATTDILYLCCAAAINSAGDVNTKALWDILYSEFVQRPVKIFPKIKQWEIEEVLYELGRWCRRYDIINPLRVRAKLSESVDIFSTIISQECLYSTLCEVLDEIYAEKKQHESGILEIKPRIADSLHFIAEKADDPSDWIHTMTFFKSIFDWNRMAIQIPIIAQSSSSIDQYKFESIMQTMRIFDWNQSGGIDMNDWNKAWRQVSTSKQDLMDWELIVLLEKFPNYPKDYQPMDEIYGPTKDISYREVLIYLTNVHKEKLHQSVLEKVRTHFYDVYLSRAKKDIWSTHALQTLFDKIDIKKRGYFYANELQQYLIREFSKLNEEGDPIQQTLNELDDTNLLLPVMEMMASNVGNHPNITQGQIIVTMHQFSDYLHRLARKRTLECEDMETSRSASGSFTRKTIPKSSVTDLSELELVIRDFSCRFVDTTNQISPALAFDALSSGCKYAPRAISEHLQSSTNSTSNPVRRKHSKTTHEVEIFQQFKQSQVHNKTGNFLSSFKSKSRHHVSIVPKALHSKTLSELLLSEYNIQVSSQLIGMWFLHIGSDNSSSLDLKTFAVWLFPLPTTVKMSVRRLIKAILTKSKAGGGKLDFDRFLSLLRHQLDNLACGQGRRSAKESNKEMFMTRPSDLLSALHRLDLPLTKTLMDILLHHFGMENQAFIKYDIFLKYLYEVVGY